jgi:Tol biopolymer transport system component
VVAGLHGRVTVAARGMKLKPWISLAGAVIVALALTASADAASGETSRVSVDSSGSQADDESGGGAISADGRFVTFYSFATNLVPGDANSTSDVFVRDRQTGATERISVDGTGNEGNGFSGQPAISADGRFVAFNSSATNLVPGDSNNMPDVFVHDRQTGATELVSVDGGGNAANGQSEQPAISADGRFVAFRSPASNLVPGDTNDAHDVFVHDRQTGATERVSVDEAGNEGNAFSSEPAISTDGRFVAFFSDSSNLVADDTNGQFDVFVHDRQTGATERVSVDGVGAQGNSSSYRAAISADGRLVSFNSDATNLVPDDTNGRGDVFVHDRQTGATERISVGGGGAQGDNDSYDPAISSDGRFVVFDSWASNLVPGDVADTYDVFVHDRQTGATERVNVDGSGAGANGFSFSGSNAISADGGLVAFTSYASNLVAGDTNGTADVFVHERGGSTAINSASQDADAGDTVATNSTTSADDPVGTSVTTPVAGTVTIEEGSTTTSDPSGYSLLSHEVQIDAPTASAASPLVIQFRLDSSILPPGADETTLQVFRNGIPVPGCDGGGGSATPDPCVADRAALTGGGIALTVRTSQASAWNFGLHVPYAFEGFLSPIAATPSLNPAKGGSTVALRFKLGGNQGLGVLASGYPRSHTISCDSASTDQGDDAQTVGSLSYDSESQGYTYRWKTSKAWAKAGTCRQFVLRLNDGSSHRADFTFK